MSKRRALLLGVPKYSSKAIPPLPFIKNDMRKLQAALESSGYQVRSIGLDKIPATPGEIRGGIHEFCNESEKEDKLLICFSGHGVHFEGDSYLVPYDARIDDPDLKRYLISVEDFKKDFENSKAETILFFVDACREGIELGTMSVGLSPFKSWDPRKLQLSKEREVAFIFSCKPGEVSRFVKKKSEAFSLFSRALAETIHADNPTVTFKELIDKIQERLDELADKYKKQPQNIDAKCNERLYDREIFDKASRGKPIEEELRCSRDKLLDQAAEQLLSDSHLYKLIQDIKGTFKWPGIAGRDTLFTGWLPSPPDARDFTVASPVITNLVKHLGVQKVELSSLPATIDLRPSFSAIEDQKNLESCTAIGVAAILEYSERKAYGSPIKLSSLFIYKNARNLMGITSGDTGSWLRAALNSLFFFGAPLEKYWPYTDQDPEFDKEPPNFVYGLARIYSGYYFRHDLGVPENLSANVLASVKKYLAAGIPSIFGFFLFPSFSQSVTNGSIPLPCENEKAQWGHSVVAVGYDDTMKIANVNCDIVTNGAFLIRNSWGTSWGDKGYGWLPYDYVLKGLAIDFWSLLNENWIDTGLFGI